MTSFQQMTSSVCTCDPTVSIVGYSWVFLDMPFHSNPLLSGTIDMNLHEMPRPSASSSSCTLDLLRVSNPTAETVNLFEQKTIKGFWPVFSNRKEGRELTVSDVQDWMRE